MRQPRTILQQQVIAEIQRNGTADPCIIAQRVGCNEYTVYRIAQEFGLEVHRTRHPRLSTIGTLNVRQVPFKHKGHATYAFIPVAALRAAGFDQAQQLTFSAQSGRIIIEPLKTTENTEPTEPKPSVPSVSSVVKNPEAK